MNSLNEVYDEIRHSSYTVISLLEDIEQAIYNTNRYINQETIYYYLIEGYEFDLSLLIEDSDDDDEEKGKGFFGTIWQKIKDFWNWITSWFRSTSEKISKAVATKYKENLTKIIKAIEDGDMDYTKSKGEGKIWFKIENLDKLAPSFNKFSRTLISEIDKIIADKKAYVYTHYTNNSLVTKVANKVIKKEDQDTGDGKYKPDKEHEMGDIGSNKEKFKDDVIKQFIFKSIKYAFGDILVLKKDTDPEKDKDYISKLTFHSDALTTTEVKEEEAKNYCTTIMKSYEKITNEIGKDLDALNDKVQKAINEIEKDVDKKKEFDKNDKSRISKPSHSTAFHGTTDEDQQKHNMGKKMFYSSGKGLTFDEFKHIGLGVFALAKKLQEKMIEVFNNNNKILKECMK